MSDDSLTRVVRNLLDNAVKFSPVGGRILIGGRPIGQSYVLNISDEGPGISPDDLPYIFERFYRGAAARNSGIQGSGLGLAIAHALARQAGCDLTAEPNGAASGARFCLRIPIHK